MATSSSMLSRARPAPPGGLDLNKTALFSSVAHSTPIRCVQLSHNPSAHVYHALKLKIERSSSSWLREFLELDGLGSLVEAVEQLSTSRFTGFSDAILLIDCLACVRAVLNSNTGMAHFLNSDIYCRKMAKGMSTGSVLCKKNVFELLTAVCVYSNLGYKRTIDALQHYQKSTDQTSMFSAIIRELKLSDTAPYRTTLMSLVNTIINCTDDTRQRTAIRNELISYQLLDLISHFRRDEKDSDLAIQLEAFSVSKHRDDLEMSQNYKLNPNSHQELFSAIIQEVLGSHDTSTFMNLLQDLYLMSSTSSQSALLWKAIGKAVHYISSLSSPKETENFMDNLEAMARPYTCPIPDQKCMHNRDNIYHQRRPSDGNALPIHPCCRLARKDSGISMGSNRSGCSDSQRSAGSFQRQGSGSSSSGYGSGRGSGRIMTRIAEVEKARGTSNRTWSKNMKNVKWIKVPKVKVRREVSLWGQGTENRLQPDYKLLEKEFSLPDRPRDADDEVELLTGAQSVMINVYLARMDMSPEEMMGYLEEGDEVKIGLSGLRYLMTVLPSHEEIMQLRNYRGERYDLGQAEQFLLLLSDLPDYRTLLSCLLFKAEFGPRYQKLKTAFTAMIKATRDILHHQGFKDFLFLALDSGNYLNYSTVFGAASGMKLCSLLRVLDVKGTEPGSSLLDCLVRMTEAQGEEVLTFLNDVTQLETAASHDLDEMKVEVTNLSTEMRKVLTQLATTHHNVKATFEYFIEDVKQDLQLLQDSITQLRSLSQQMSLYFCEDESTFRLHTALQQIHTFCAAIKRRTREGIQGRQQKTLAETRQQVLKDKCIESRMARVFGKQAGANSTFMTVQTEKVVDCLLNEVHSGNILSSLGDDLGTPDLEWDDLHVSHIAPVASPIVEEELFLPLATLEEGEEEGEEFRPCLPDRIEEVIGRQYRKDNQVASSSFISPENNGNGKEEHPRATLASPEEDFVIRKPTRPQQPPKATVKPQPTKTRPTALEARVEGEERDLPGRPLHNNPQVMKNKETKHRRTASDPNDSHNADQKWDKYESKKNKRRKKVRIESNVPIASLGLEKNGQTLSRDDFLDMAETEDKENAPQAQKEKKKKRSSFGLLKKLTRALKPRNSDNLPEKNEGTIQKAVRPTTLSLNLGKENVGFTESSQYPSEVSYRVYESRTSVEEVQEEPMYKIVVYQKYSNTDC